MSSAWVNENVNMLCTYKLLQSGATMLLSMLMVVKHDLDRDLTIQKYSIVSKSKYLMTLMAQKATAIVQIIGEQKEQNHQLPKSNLAR